MLVVHCADVLHVHRAHDAVDSRCKELVPPRICRGCPLPAAAWDVAVRNGNRRSGDVSAVLLPLLYREAPGQQAEDKLFERRSSLEQEQLELALVAQIVVVEIRLLAAMVSEEFLLERIQPLSERAVKFAVLRGSVADIPLEARHELLHVLSARLLHRSTVRIF